MDTTLTPGAAQAIAHHNHEADQAHRQALRALKDYSQAMGCLQDAVVTSNVQAAAQAEAEADAAWQELQGLLAQGYQYRNSAVIAAGLAAELESARKATVADGGQL
jgi:hypothetical protein